MAFPNLWAMKSVVLMLQELEKQLIIFPERGLVNAYEIILQKIQPPRYFFLFRMVPVLVFEKLNVPNRKSFNWGCVHYVQDIVKKS
jgi:hypothetical protein